MLAFKGHVKEILKSAILKNKQLQCPRIRIRRSAVYIVIRKNRFAILILF